MQTNVPFTASICWKISFATARSSFTRGTQSQPFLINAFLCTTMTFFQVFIGLSINLLFYIQTNCFCTPPPSVPTYFALSEPHPCIIGSNVFCLISWKFREFVIFPPPSLWNWHTEFIFQSQRKRRIFTVGFTPLKRPSVIVELWKWSKPAWPPWIHLCDVCGFIICLLKKQRLNLQLDQIKDAVYRNISQSFPCCGLPRCGRMQMIVFTYDFKTQVKWNKVKSRWHAYWTITAPKAAELFAFCQPESLLGSFFWLSCVSIMTERSVAALMKRRSAGGNKQNCVTPSFS